MDALRGLLAAFGLRTREPAVTGRHAAEAPLARTEFGPRAVLHPLDFELSVLIAEGAVTANTLGHLHGGATEHRYRGELVFMGSWVCARKIPRSQMGAENSPRAPSRTVHDSGPRERLPLESQQIYIAKLINGGEIQ